jgi:hypothetical protein
MVMSQVIEQDLTSNVPHAGPIDATLGGVITDDAVINVVVTGDPAIIDIVIEERLAEGEGFGDTLRSIATEGQTFAGIDLDYVGAKGLVRLLNQAITLCETREHSSS